MISDAEMRRRTEAWAIRVLAWFDTHWLTKWVWRTATECDIDNIDREFYVEGGGDA